jgi:hypothetical protein
MRELSRVQAGFEVAYSRIVVVSVDPAGGAGGLPRRPRRRFTFLSDEELPRQERPVQLPCPERSFCGGRHRSAR